MNLLSLEVVCTITGFEEAARRGGRWEHTAAAPNSQCTRSEQRQGDNTDPRLHWGAANSHLGFFFSKPRSSVASTRSTDDFFILLFCPIVTTLTSLRGQAVWSQNSAMTSPAKFRKDKEIVAEYETQVKGKTLKKLSIQAMYRAMYAFLPIERAFLGVADCMGFCTPTSLISFTGYAFSLHFISTIYKGWLSICGRWRSNNINMCNQRTEDHDQCVLKRARL